MMPDGVVYVIDDDPSLRRALAQLVEAAGFDVETFPSAEAFLGQPMPTVTFTLIESRPPDEALYQLEGHLTSPHRVFSRTAEPERRRELLMRWCGPQARRWLGDAPRP